MKNFMYEVQYAPRKRCYDNIKNELGAVLKESFVIGNTRNTIILITDSIRTEAKERRKIYHGNHAKAGVSQNNF